MHPPAAREQYLEAAIASAPPARLRLMLIERGNEIARWLAAEAEAPVDASARAGQCLRLRDILGELLSGVAAGQATPVATQVSDLYVFLLQHLTRAEADGDRTKFAQIAEVLEIERQTWTEVCAATGKAPAASATRSPGQAPIVTGNTASSSSGVSSLNLQA